MTPDHNDNPFNSPEFRREMGKMFDEKLTPLVTTVSDQGKMLDVHDEYIQQQKGGAWMIRYLINGIIALVAGWFGAKVH